MQSNRADKERGKPNARYKVKVTQANGTISETNTV